MNPLPYLFRLQAALGVLSRWTDVLPAVGGATDTAEPVHERLDELCEALWGVDERGLRAIQSAYRDLYVNAPTDAVEKDTLAGENADV